MSYIVSETGYTLREFDINTNTGASSIKGPITLRWGP